MKVKRQVELEFIRKSLEELTFQDLARELGYKSPSTILHWISRNQIPNLALGRVRMYVRSKSKKGKV